MPTVIVPFFGDQPFWGGCVHRMGVGPAPVPYKGLTKEKLTEAFLYCTKPEVVAAAQVCVEEERREEKRPKGEETRKERSMVSWGGT